MDSQDGGREAVALARRFFAAVTSGDVDGALALADPEAVWVPFTARGQELVGHDAIRAHVDGLADRGIETEARAVDYEPIGDCVIVRGNLRRRDGSVLAESQLHWLYRVRDGKIVRMEAHTRRESAVRSIEAFAAAY